MSGRLTESEAGAADGQFLLETFHARDLDKRQSVGGHDFTCHRGSNLEDISSCREPGKRLSFVEARTMFN